MDTGDAATSPRKGSSSSRVAKWHVVDYRRPVPSTADRTVFTARLRADADDRERRRFVDFVSSIVHGVDGTRPPKAAIIDCQGRKLVLLPPAAPVLFNTGVQWFHLSQAAAQPRRGVTRAREEEEEEGAGEEAGLAAAGHYHSSGSHTGGGAGGGAGAAGAGTGSRGAPPVKRARRGTHTAAIAGGASDAASKRDPKLQPCELYNSPTLEVLRYRLLQGVHDAFAEALAVYRGSLNYKTKSSRSMIRDGIREGCSGYFGRWVFHHKEPEIESGDYLDPMVPCPKSVDSHIVHELEEAGLSTVAATSVVQVLTTAGVKAAKTMEQHNARRPSAADCAVAVRHVAAGQSLQPNGSGPRAVRDKVVLSHKDVELVMNKTHYDKLCRLYRAATPPAGVDWGEPGVTSSRAQRMDERIFCVMQRYETLSGATSGYQGALPDHTFEAMRATFGVNHECFASPLNCYYGNFCSLFYDTDRHFGSVGSFFKFRPTTGSFEANPPFVNDVMTQNVRHITELLAASAEPLSFIIVVPAWDDDKCESYQLTTHSKYLRHTVRLGKKQHQYKDGMQHRVDRVTWDANVASFMFWMQNDAGARKWPVTPQTLAQFEKATHRKAINTR